MSTISLNNLPRLLCWIFGRSNKIKWFYTKKKVKKQTISCRLSRLHSVVFSALFFEQQGT